MKGIGLMYLMLALCVPGALGLTALAYWLDSIGMVWLSIPAILLIVPPYAIAVVSVTGRVEARHD